MTGSEMAVAPAIAPRRRLEATRALAVGLWLLGVALSLVSLWIIGLTLDQPAPGQYAFRGFEASIGLPWGLVGALIAIRRPANRLGWLALLGAVAVGIQGVVDQYPVLADAGRGPADTAVLFRWVSSWEWVLGMSMLLIGLPLIFPDGRLLSPRWRPALALGVIGIVGVIVAIGASTQPIGPDPLTRDMTLMFRANPMTVIPFLLFILASVLAVTSLVLRFVRSRGDLRQQIKWVAYGGVAGMLGLGLDFTPNPVAQAVGSVTAIFGAACVGIAILRYRLYEIDLLINRTFVYGALTAILAGVYTASITLTTRLFSAVTGERSDAAVVLTTLIVVSLFTPLKSRLQAAVDNRLKKPHPPAMATASVPAELAEDLKALHAEWHRAGGKDG